MTSTQPLPELAMQLSPPELRVRRTLLFLTIACTMTIAVGLSIASYVRPAGDGGELPSYNTIEPMREFLWSFFIVAAVNLIIGVCAVAIAGWILTAERGAHWATVGGAVVWLGAALYGVGTGGWAAAYYFSTEPLLGRADGTTLVDRINHDVAHLMAVPVAGAVLIGMGSIVMSVGLWRARTIPRWIVIASVAGGVVTFLAPPDTLLGIATEAGSSATAIAIGWYAWRRATPLRRGVWAEGRIQ